MSQPNSKSVTILPNGCGCLFVWMLVVGIISNGFYKGFVTTSPHRAKQSEAKQYVSSMNRGQQQYFAEKNVFGTSINALELGIKTETRNYKYSVRATKKAAFSYGVSKNKSLRGYVGGVFVIQVKSNNAKDEMRTDSILCSADKPGIIPPLPPRLQNGKVVCETGTTQVTK